MDTNELIKRLFDNGKGEYVEKLKSLPVDELTKLVDTINEIGCHYKDKYSTQLKGTVTSFKSIIDSLQEKREYIPYSYTYRTKDPDSLILKIVTKFLDEKFDSRITPNYLLINARN